MRSDYICVCVYRAVPSRGAGRAVATPKNITCKGYTMLNTATRLSLYTALFLIIIIIKGNASPGL